MTINITDTFGTPILAKDIAPSRNTLKQLDNATAAAHNSRSHKAYTLISMANHTQQLATITVD